MLPLLFHFLFELFHFESSKLEDQIRHLLGKKALKFDKLSRMSSKTSSKILKRIIAFALTFKEAVFVLLRDLLALQEHLFAHLYHIHQRLVACLVLSFFQHLSQNFHFVASYFRLI